MAYPSDRNYTEWKQTNTCYTLKELFSSQFPDCSDLVLPVIDKLTNSKQKSNKASHISSALCHFFLKHIFPFEGECCTYEEEFSCFQHLPSFATSNKFKADCCLCLSTCRRKVAQTFTSFRLNKPSSCSVCKVVNIGEGSFEKLKGEDALPVVPIEIDSGKIQDSVRKCGIAVLENLRLVRSFGLEVYEWSGFFFPNITQQGAVVKVTVMTTSERPFYFKVVTEVLTMDFVNETVKTVYCKQKEILRTAYDSNSELDDAFVFKLSQSELASFAEGFMESIDSKNSFKCVQIPSITSFTLYCYNEKAAYYLKHLIGTNQSYNLQTVEAKVKKCKCDDHPVLLSKMLCVLKESQFHCFVALPVPLSTLEARHCLREFVQFVSKSLQRLHEDYHLAHTDVRTDNICFTSDGSRAIFIDIDRCSITYEMIHEKWCNSNSALYHREFTNEQIDWRQLGCTIYWILKCTSRGSVNQCDSIHKLNVKGRST